MHRCHRSFCTPFSEHLDRAMFVLQFPEGLMQFDTGGNLVEPKIQLGMFGVSVARPESLHEDTVTVLRRRRLGYSFQLNHDCVSLPD